MKILWHGGVTRTVILTKRWAIKLPCLVYGWRYFLYGFLANMQERDWAGSDDRLYPVRFVGRGGWVLVMPRCEALSDEDFIAEVAEDFAMMCDRSTGEKLSAELPVEMKACSFGRLNGKIVAVDYGGCGRDGRTTMLIDQVVALQENAESFQGTA